MFDTLERVELAADLTPESLRSTLNDVLAELGDRVAPTSLARERLVPVHESLRPLFPDGGLVRGRVHACSGSGGTTMAMAMARDAVVSGAWMAVVDVDTFGVDAASELGVALERVVRVDTGGDGHTADDADAVDRADPAVDPGRRWLEVMAAAVDGFDIVLATVPTAWRTPEGARRASGGLRSLVARLQQRGSVVILTGPTGSVPVDVSVRANSTWEGLGHGHGVISSRQLRARSTGRRQPNPASCELELVAAGHRLELRAVPEVGTDHVSSPDLRLVV